MLIKGIKIKNLKNYEKARQLSHFVFFQTFKNLAEFFHTFYSGFFRICINTCKKPQPNNY